MFIVYIIQSAKSGKWYYGMTSEPDRRLEAHNLGRNKSTARDKPWRYIFHRKFDSKSDALAFERYLKKTKNKAYISSKYAVHFL